MGVLVDKQKGRLCLTSVAKLSLVGMTSALAFVYFNTIWAVYLDSFVGSTVFVGFLSSFLTVVAFFAAFFFVPIIERKNKSRIYAFSLFFFIVAYVLFAFNRNFYLMMAIAIFMTLLTSLRTASFGILVRDNSSRKLLSRNEGVIYTALNISWVIGPLIAGYALSSFGFRGVFLLAACFVALGFSLFEFFKIKGDGKKKRADGNMFKNFIAFFSDKRRSISYFLGAGVNMWWALIYLFIPLRIVHSGLDVLWIGYFFFVVAVPLVLFEYYFSEWAGRHGFRKIFKRGYLFVAIMAVACFFAPNIYFVLGLLALASVGMAMLEPTTEAYFFDTLRGTEEYRFYGPYNTAINFGAFVGRLVPSILLIFLPFEFIFLLFGALMFSLFLLSFKVCNIVESKRKSC